MSDKSCHEGVSYKLRTGQPQSICGCPCTSSAQARMFVMQSFGAERRAVKSYRATTEILESNDFIGMNPEAVFESASYNALPYTSGNNELFFQGQEQSIPTYIDESQMPGVSDFIV